MFQFESATIESCKLNHAYEINGNDETLIEIKAKNKNSKSHAMAKQER